MISIVQYVQIPKNLNIGHITKLSQQILDNLGKSTDEISIVLDDNAGIEKFNTIYAKEHKPTDVLSFSANEMNPDSGNKYLGDIIISIEKVITQSIEKGHSTETELITLITHGILHLLDFDHTDQKSARMMFEKQNDLVSKVIGE